MKSRIYCLLFLLLSSLLGGCVAVMVAGTAAGMVVYDKRNLRTIENDTRLYYLVRKGIVRDSRMRGSHIEVISFNQIVLLVGQTPVDAPRAIAEKIAQNTPQVKRVYNEVTVGPDLSLGQRSKDVWITGQVRSYMLGRKGLESGSIRVVTENATVYLMGIVTQEQANIAVDVARQVNGVKKVVKVFQYF